MNKIFKMRRINDMAILRLRRRMYRTMTKLIYYHFEEADRFSKHLDEILKDIPVTEDKEYTWNIMTKFNHV